MEFGNKKKVKDLTPDEMRSTLEAILDAVIGGNMHGSASDIVNDVERAFRHVDIVTEIDGVLDEDPLDDVEDEDPLDDLEDEDIS